MNMDAGSQQTQEFTVNFDLLTDDLELVEPDKMDKDVLNIADDIDELLQQINTGDPQENDDEFAEFLSQNANMRFNDVTDKDLNDLEAENEAKSTHWQTTWAVKILRGNNFNIFIQIIQLFPTYNCFVYIV